MTKQKLVRYVSPFGTPAWMTRERAQALLEEDDQRYVKYQNAGVLTYFTLGVASSQCDGPPRIEIPS